MKSGFSLSPIAPGTRQVLNQHDRTRQRLYQFIVYGAFYSNQVAVLEAQKGAMKDHQELELIMNWQWPFTGQAIIKNLAGLCICADL